MAEFAKDWLGRAQRIQPNLTSAASSMIPEMFTKTYGPKLEADRKAIASMFMQPVLRGGQPVIDPETKRPMNWFQYVSKNASNLTPAEKSAIEKRYGEGILRYFPEVRR